MSRLLEAVKTIVGQALEGRPVVVWYDSGGSLGPIAAQLPDHGIPVLAYDGSFLALRVAFEESDPGLAARTVLYVARARPEPSWLRDLELAGTCLRFGLAEAVNSGFGIATTGRQREQLAGPVGQALAARWDELVPAQPSTTDLSLAMLAAVLDLGVHADLRNVVLEYVARDDAPTLVERANLQPELADLLASQVGLHGLSERDVPQSRLAAALLLSEATATGGLATEGLGEALPDESHRSRWCSWTREWMRWEDDASFVRWSEHVSQLYRVPDRLTGPIEAVAKIEAFAVVDDVCRRRVESLVQGGSLDEARRVADSRRNSRWARRDEAAGGTSAWEVVVAAVDLLDGSPAAVSVLDGRASWELVDLLGRYYDDWWQLDDAYRRLEAGWTTASRALTEAAVVPAAHVYADFLDKLAFAACAAASSAAAWGVEGWSSQREVAAGHLDAGPRTALVLADALRLDLARIVGHRLRQSGVQVEELRTLAALPSVTEVGMAAIQLPGWEERTLAIEGRGLVPVIGGVRYRTREERLSGLRSRFPAAEAVELDAVNEHRSVPDAHPLVVFARAIDEQGDNLPDVQLDLFDRLARRMAEAVLRLLDHGYATVLVIPDHGFLLSPKSVAVPTVAAPASDSSTVRSRRYAVGRPSDVDGTLRIPLRALGWSTDGDALFPLGRGVFGLPGAAPRFFHGGLLPQEVAVASLVCRRPQSALPRTGVIIVDPAQIVTTIPRFVLRGESDSFATSRRVRVVVRVDGRVVAESETVEVAAGEVREISLRLESYGRDAHVAVEDVESREVVTDRVIPIELPPGYEDVDL